MVLKELYKREYNRVAGSKELFVIFFHTSCNHYFSSLTKEKITPPLLFHQKQAERWSTAAQGEGGLGCRVPLNKIHNTAHVMC